MRLILLDAKRCPTFPAGISSDPPEVCLGSRKRSFLQTKKASRNRFQTFPFIQHQPAEPNPRHTDAFFESTTAIEYP
jgi:hypothetical protein